MQVPILIEPVGEGRFRARAGEPFTACVEAASAEAARRELEVLLRQRLQNGTQLAVIDVGNGPAPLPASPLHLEPLPDDDWFFQTMREAIAENRRREDEANP
jgi:hypothetical protein